jgi:hypothetical protein
MEFKGCSDDEIFTHWKNFSFALPLKLKQLEEAFMMSLLKK